MNEAEHFVGQMCLTYLSFSDFETQIETRKPEFKVKQSPDVLSFGAASWIFSIFGISSSLFKMPYRLLGATASTAAPGIDYKKYLTPASATTDTAAVKKLVEKYQLLLYILEYWMFYTKSFKDRQMSQELHKIARHKQLSFEFRPWGPNQHHGRYGCVSCASNGATELTAKRLPFMSMLHYAAEVGHWPLMEPLINDYCSHESGDDETLVIACRAGHLSIVKKLIQSHTFNLSNEKAIIAAGASGNEKVFAYLLEATASDYPWSTKGGGSRPLILASANGYEAIVETLCQRGAFINAMDSSTGETALSAAASNGHGQIVQILVANGARILTTGKTPLHSAAENGHDAVVRTLLLANVDYDHQDRPLHLVGALDQNGETPLHKASRNGHHAAVEAMLKLTPTMRDWVTAYTRKIPYRQQAIHLAALNGHVSVLALLAEHGSIGAQDSNARTPLMIASMEGHVPVAQFLLNHYTSHEYGLRDKDGFSARDLAIIGGHENVLKAILEVKPELTNHEMISSLVLAASVGNKAVLTTFIQTIADVRVNHRGLLFALSETQSILRRKIIRREKHLEAMQLLGVFLERFTPIAQRTRPDKI